MSTGRSHSTRAEGSSEDFDSDDDDLRLTITVETDMASEDEQPGTSSRAESSGSSGSTHKCNICEEVVPSAHGLSLHLRRAHDVISCTSSQRSPSQHSCKLCGKTLSSASSLDRHMLVHSGERPFKCDICGMAFTTNGNMHRHMRTHSGAPLLGQVHGQLVQVQPSIPQDFRCLICGRLFLKKTALEKHAKAVHDNPPVGCPKCFGWCSTYLAYINGQHSCVHQPPTAVGHAAAFDDVSHVDFACSKFGLIAAVQCDRKPRRSSPSAANSYECDRCTGSFPSEEALAIHGQRHDDQQQTFCILCRTSYSSNVELQSHQAQMHREPTDEKAHLMAALRLAPTNQAARHDLSDVQTLLSLANSLPNAAAYSVGETESENSCDSLTDLSVGNATKHFSCTMCGVAFEKVQLLKRHLQMHVNAPFACTLCSYRSTDKSTLVRHLRTHNGERPFQCAVCKFAFTTKANCERHIRKRHEKQTKSEIRSAMQYNPHMQSQQLSPTFSPQKDSGSTICKYCHKDFKFQRVLRHHLRSLNNSCSRKPFCCIICKLGFSTKNNCIRHVLKQHPDFQNKLSEAVSSKPLPADESSGGQNPPVPLTFDNDQEADDEGLEDMDESQSSDHIVPRSFEQTDPTAKTLKTVILSPVKQVVGALHNISPVDLGKATPIVFTTVEAPNNLKTRTVASPTIAKVSVIPAAHQKVKEQHPGKIEPPQDEPLDLAVHALDLSRKVRGPKPLPAKNHSFIDAILTAARYVPETSTPPPSPGSAVKMRPEDLTKAFVLSDKTKTALKILVNAKKTDAKAPEEQHDLASVSTLLNAANSHLVLQHLTGDNDDQETAEVTRPEPFPRNDTPDESIIVNAEARKDTPNSVSCVYCRRKFPWTSSLRRHLLTHTGQKPFKCPHCPIWFTTKSNCERHLLRKHNKLAKPCRSMNSRKRMGGRASTSDLCSEHCLRRPCCPCCSRQFRSKKSLDEHLRQPAATPFRCVVCCDLFAEAATCLQHAQQVHELRLHPPATLPAAELSSDDESSKCFVCLEPVGVAGLPAHFRAAHGGGDSNNNDSSRTQFDG